MINDLKFVDILQKGLDKSSIIHATSGWMEENAKDVLYRGGKEIKVPMLTVDGMGDYDRDYGFDQGSVNLRYKTMEMTQDRGKTFSVDAMDLDETHFFTQASEVMATFQRERVIPEIDSYRYSKISYEAITAKRFRENYEPTEKTILRDLMDDIAKVKNKIGYGTQIIISLNNNLSNILDFSSHLSRILQPSTFKQGNVEFNIKTLNDCPIINIPSERMFTEYEFKTSGHGEGFVTTKDSRVINWIITAKNAPIAVSKTDSIRLFSPEKNQQKNAYKLDYRKHHDLWVLPSKLDSIFVNIK